MLQTQIIGCGAAGGKCVAQFIKDGVILEDNCLIVNSTIQDKPDCNCKFINIGKNNDLGGAAKEPSKGKQMCIEALQGEFTETLQSFVKPTTKKVYIVTSLEGGTGCGSSVIIAQFMKQVMGQNVHIIAITGFEDDPRGLKNTIQFFQQIDPDYTVSIISNKKFLKDANNDKLKAEQLCNREISTLISVLNGQMIVASSKNIDDNDLYKLSTKSGYMNISYAQVDERIRNTEQFNSFIKDMIDNSKSMDLVDPKQTTLGIIINLPEDEQQYIDYSYKVLTDHYNSGDSTCYEVFTHIQHDSSKVNFIAFINAGMQLPLEEVQRMYDNYSSLKAKSEIEAREKKNQFFSGMNAIVFDDDDDNDLKESSSTKSANDFLASLTGGQVKSNNSSNKLDNNF